MNSCIRKKICFYNYLLILAVLGILCISILFFWHTDFTWHTWPPATCMPNCFCEALHTGSNILQPVNTGSSLAFAVVSLLIIVKEKKGFSSGKERSLNSFTTYWPYPLIYSMALIIAGFGSAFYHASLTFSGQYIDVLGMYLTTTFMLSYALHRLWQSKHIYTLQYLRQN